MKPKRNGKSDAMRAAMWLWGQRYSHQRGGSMDFFAPTLRAAIDAALAVSDTLTAGSGEGEKQ